MGVLSWLRGRRTRPVHQKLVVAPVVGTSPVPRPPAFAVIDVETTGLSPQRDRVLELAIVRLDESGDVVDEWVSRFNPDGPVGATHIHGITEADVAGQPRFADVAPTVKPSSHFVEYDHVLFPGQTPRGRGTTLRALYRGPHPAPNPQWLRDSWLLQLIRALPFSIVMQAVGTSDVVRFRRYFDAAHLDFAHWTDAVRNPAAYGAGVDDISTYEGSPWQAADEKAREEVTAATLTLNDEPLGSPAPLAADSDNTSVVGGEAPRLLGRPRPRDRDRGNYERRPMTAANHEHPRMADSTAFPAGTPVVPFKRGHSLEQQDGVQVRPAGEEGHGRRRIKALEAEWTPKRPRKKSRYEALPPGSTYLAAAPDDPTAAVSEDRTDSAASRFDAFRAELLAEARRSARGGKR